MKTKNYVNHIWFGVIVLSPTNGTPLTSHSFYPFFFFSFMDFLRNKTKIIFENCFLMNSLSFLMFAGECVYYLSFMCAYITCFQIELDCRL